MLLTCLVSPSPPFLIWAFCSQLWEARETIWLGRRDSQVRLGQDALCQRVWRWGLSLEQHSSCLPRAIGAGTRLCLCLWLWVQAGWSQEPVELGWLPSQGLVRWLDDSQHAGETDQPVM